MPTTCLIFFFDKDQIAVFVFSLSHDHCIVFFHIFFVFGQKYFKSERWVSYNWMEYLFLLNWLAVEQHEKNFLSCQYCSLFSCQMKFYRLLLLLWTAVLVVKIYWTPNLRGLWNFEFRNIDIASSLLLKLLYQRFNLVFILRSCHRFESFKSQVKVFLIRRHLILKFLLYKIWLAFSRSNFWS